jgi:hypothetical protein
MRQLALFVKPRKARPAPEFNVCCLLADTLERYCHPEWFWTHFPAGEKRTKATGARLRRMGTKPGVADYLLISPEGQLHALEMKRSKTELLTFGQERFRDWCRAHGVPWHRANSYDEAVEVLNLWGVWKGSIKPQ